MSYSKCSTNIFRHTKAAVDAGVGSVMASFNDVNGVPATANKYLMTDVLREQGLQRFIGYGLYRHQ